MSAWERSCATWRVLFSGAVLVAMSACSANVVLRRPPELESGTLGPFRRCEAPDRPCQDDAVYDSSRLNAANTRFFRLPDCPYGISDLVVQDTGSEDAVVLVRCAGPAPTLQPMAAVSDTPGAGLPTTSVGGGVTSSSTLSP